LVDDLKVYECMSTVCVVDEHSVCSG
jgi:hypothetical protein